MELPGDHLLIFSLKPSLLIEFGSFNGGSALFFASLLRQMGKPFKVLTVDVDHSRIPEQVRTDPTIEFLTMSSSAPEVGRVIARLRTEFLGPVFAILDSDHNKEHVLAEMMLLRPLLKRGDYVIVEDSNINGHPVLPLWGPGPYEAVEEYVEQFPDDFTFDTERENKFGFTFAPHGFLMKT